MLRLFTIILSIGLWGDAAALGDAALLRDDAELIAVSEDKEETRSGIIGVAPVIPPDVSLVLHMENAAAIRRELAERPISQWFSELGATSRAAEVWRDLSAHMESAPGGLFDICFGTRATLITRHPQQWTIITRVRARDSAHLLQQLHPIVHGPRFGMAMLELPEHDLLIAHGQRDAEVEQSTLVIGPKSDSGLFEAVLSRMENPGGKSLADKDAVGAAARLGVGSIAMYTAHDPPMGGWSVAVAQLDGQQLQLRHVGRFDSAPFERGRSSMTVDGAALRGFEDHALLAIIEPTDVGGGQFEAYFRASFGTQMISGPIHRNLCQRRIFVVGEVEGRQEAPPVDIQAPTLAICFELRNPDIAEEQFDRHMLMLARRLAQLSRGAFEIDVPCPSTFEQGEPRVIDISPATRWLARTLPLAQPITLNWRVVAKADGEAGGWAVLATHPQQLEESVRALRVSEAEGPGQEGQHLGFASGVRIGQHLRSWSDRADLFVDQADAEQTEQFRQTLLLMSRLASGIDVARWRLVRPSDDEVCLEVTLELAEPESAGH